MTTDIKRQFFKTFGIEPREFKSCDVDSFCPYEGQICSDTCPYYKTYKVDYPQITDSHYLKMICLIAEKLNCFTSYDIDYKNLKEYILKEMILEKDYFDKQQVQSLFEEIN